jgi:hypothetical protein
MDAQSWSGLTRLKDVFERLRPRLLVFQDEHGRELFDLPNAPRPDPDTPAPVRFLPDYDNVVLGHADRRRIISEEDRKNFFTVNGVIPGAVLVDGFVKCSWTIKRDRESALLQIGPLQPLLHEDLAEITEEGLRLLCFVARNAASRNVSIS